MHASQALFFTETDYVLFAAETETDSKGELVFCYAIASHVNDSIRVSAVSKEHWGVTVKGLAVNSEYLGRFLRTYSSEHKLYYTHSCVDRTITERAAYYSLKVYDIAEEFTDSVQVPFVPWIFPDSIYTDRTIRSISNGVMVLEATHINNMDSAIESAYSDFRRNLEETKYYPPVRELRSDGRHVFAFSFGNPDGEGILTGVIDVDSGELVSRAVFPFIPEYIRDGRMYRIRKGGDVFPRVEVYAIAPTVYGR